MLINKLFYFFIIQSFFPFTSPKYFYNFSTYNQFENYDMRQFNNTNFNSTGVCVTINDLISFHYSDKAENIDSLNVITPDNFCYGILQYNITREDFMDIIQKNRIPMYLFYNITNNAIMDDGCIGYYKMMMCVNEFPACIDNGNKTFKASPICKKICNKYRIRCNEFYFPELCNRTSRHAYCAGKSPDSAGYNKANFLWILFIILFVF